MESTLFTELTLTEQETVSGGGFALVIAKQKNSNKTNQKAVAFGGKAENKNETYQANVISVGEDD